MGNEDGADHIAGVLLQTLDDVGHRARRQFDLLETRGNARVDYQDIDETPEAVVSVTTKLAANAAHLARLLKQQQYSAVG